MVFVPRSVFRHVKVRGLNEFPNQVTSFDQVVTTMTVVSNFTNRESKEKVSEEQ